MPEAPASHDALALDWPQWVVGGSVGLSAAFGIGALVQRHELFSPGRDHLFVLLTLLPWLIAAAGRPTPPWFDIALMCAGVLGLVVHPVNVDFSPFLLVLLAGGMTAATGRRWGLVAAIAGGGVMAGVDIAGRFQGAVVWIVAIFVGYSAGAIYQQLLLANTSLRAAQADLALRAAAEERQRIAREVHDVIAHTLAVTMLHLTGARMALKRGDAADAENALLEAEQLGRQSLADVRRSVGLLAQGPRDATAPPEPTAVDIAELVREYADAGLHVELRASGNLDGLSLAAGLGLYRIAQESLANAARHAADTTVTVALAVDGGAILTVVNTRPEIAPARSTDGRGVDGIKERAALLGGRADVGPTTDGGWRVEAVIPRVIRVLLVDDQQLVRTGLSRILHEDAGFALVGECEDGDEVAAAVARTAPDVVVMDIRMKRMDGVEATRQLAAAGGPPVLVLTTFDDDELLSAALRAGATGFQLKDAPGEDIIRAVTAVAGGGAWLDPAITGRVLATYRASAPGSDAHAAAAARFDTLTAREQDVLRLIGRGRTNAEIAAELYVGDATVKSHIGHIFTKLDLRDRAAAIVFAFDHGIVTPGS